MELPAYPRSPTAQHHSDSDYLACGRPARQKDAFNLGKFATPNGGTIAAIVQMAKRSIPFELQSARTVWAV